MTNQISLQSALRSAAVCGCIAELEIIKQGTMGFLARHQAVKLGACSKHRLTPILARCGGCRFVTSAQDVMHLVDIIERERSDYLRDLSFPVGGAS